MAGTEERVSRALCSSQMPTLGRVVSDGQMTRKTNRLQRIEKIYYGMRDMGIQLQLFGWGNGRKGNLEMM